MAFSDDPEIVSLREEVFHLLFDKPLPVQGAVLAELTAMWVAANVHPNYSDARFHFPHLLTGQFMRTVELLTASK